MTNLWIASFIWAFSFSLIKGQLTGLSSLLVAFIRLGISLLIFLPFFRLKKTNKKQLFTLMLVGALQFGIMYIAYIQSFKTLQAYEIALFTIFTPFYVTIINDIRNKKLNKLNLLAVFITIVGTFIIKQGWKLDSFPWLGFGLMQISNLAFALGQYVYSKMTSDDDEKPYQNFAALYLGAVLVTGIPMLFTLTGNPFATITSTQWMTLLYLGVIASGIGFFLWNTGAKKVSTGNLAVMNNMKIPLTILVALVFFGETTNIPFLLIGGGLIVLAEIMVLKHTPKA